MNDAVVSIEKCLSMNDVNKCVVVNTVTGARFK